MRPDSVHPIGHIVRGRIGTAHGRRKLKYARGGKDLAHGMDRDSRFVFTMPKEWLRNRADEFRVSDLPDISEGESVFGLGDFENKRPADKGKAQERKQDTGKSPTRTFCHDSSNSEE